ncbi:MAG: molecular chaperone DnaJ, partial [Bdellovibrionales bacterium]|nr:molecular chaperone DnaJ [Bdellovibrionales bacterium]
MKYTLVLSLEEMVFGAEKTIRFMRHRDHAEEPHEMRIVVPPETFTGQKLRIKSAGDGSKSRFGDLFVHIHGKKHPLLEVHGRNLKLTAPVDLQTALLGGEIQVPGLKKLFELRIPAGTQPGTILRLQGKGLPKTAHSPAGDLLVQVV